MISQRISYLLSLWQEGQYDDSDVVAWADHEILTCEEEVPDALVELSLHGAKNYLEMKKPDWPLPAKLTDIELFSLKLSAINLDNTAERRGFITWFSNIAVGGEATCPICNFGYFLDHYLSYEDIDPDYYFCEHISQYFSLCEAIVNTVIAKVKT